MRYEPYVDTWKNHNARYERTPAAVDRGLARRGVVLSPMERRAVINFAEHVGDLAAEAETAEQLTENLVAEHLIEAGPVFVRFLAAFAMEYVLAGSHWLPDVGDHVAANGVLGSAISEASDRLDPMIRNQEPIWYENVTQTDDSD